MRALKKCGEGLEKMWEKNLLINQKNMKIELKEIQVKDVFAWYKNSDEEWVIWYNWLLNIRPKYQREFV